MPELLLRLRKYVRTYVRRADNKYADHGSGLLLSCLLVQMVCTRFDVFIVRVK